MLGAMILLAPFLLASAEPVITACTTNGFQAGEHAYGIDDTLRFSWQLSNPAKGKSLPPRPALVCC